MKTRIHMLSFVLVTLVCSVALRGQTEKQSAPAKGRSLATLSAQEVFKRVSPSVMVVESLDAEGKVTKFGSGVVIAPGKVITNRHVIENGISFRIEHSGKKWPAKLIKVDPDHDLAELSVDDLKAPSVPVRESSALDVGEKVYAIGSPEGLELTISEGLTSGLRDFDKGRVIQTSAAISPGSSGGGLFDAQGRLVGITTFYLKEGQSLNFALPAEWSVALNRQAPSATARLRSPAFQALIWFELGYATFRDKRFEAAAGAFKQGTRLKPDEAVGWFGLGLAYSELGQYDKAVVPLEAAMRLKPGEHDGWIALADAYGRIGQDEKAVRAYREALQLKPKDHDAWRKLGAVYESLDQYDKALSSFQEALRLKPDDELAWLGLGLEYDNLRQYNHAVSALQEALRLKPDDYHAWTELASVYDSLGEYDKAISTFHKALQLNPDDNMTWKLLGASLAASGQYGRAATAFRQALRLRPNDAQAWYNLGLAYRATGQQTNVIKVYERLKALDPEIADKFFREEILP